jgi:dTDP-glucose 4,6-dehydratase
MKLLVTGNCGFIGQNFVRMFRDKYEIVGMDKLGYASDMKALDLCLNHIMDITDKEDVEGTIANEKPEIIINFAAESHVDNSINSPEPFMYSNFIGTFNLLEAARKCGVRRFVQIGTDEVYGDLQPYDSPFSDKFKLKPSSPYSASKTAADVLVLSYHRTYGMNTVITRTCNNYGPFQYKEKFLPVIIMNALNDSPIPVYGVGKNIREWIYVEDNCEGLEAAMVYGKSGGIYHIGTGEEFENLDMVKKILAIMNKPESLITFVTDRKGHDLRYALDNSLTYSELKWKPKISIEDGLKKTINWIEKNPNYWKECND